MVLDGRTANMSVILSPDASPNCPHSGMCPSLRDKLFEGLNAVQLLYWLVIAVAVKRQITVDSRDCPYAGGPDDTAYLPGTL